MQHSVDLNGLLYSVHRYGQGHPLLLLHGFTGSARTWAGQIPAFSQHFLVIMPNLPGHGDTESPLLPERYRIEQAAADMIALCDRWELERVHLLGYSMGGRLALYMALHYPVRFASLTLESTSPGLKTEEERAARRRSDEDLADRIEQDGLEAFVDYWEALPLWHSQQHSLSDEARQVLRQERLHQQPQGLANSLRGMGTGAQPSLWPELANLTIPTQLIVGELDKKFVATNREMQTLLPDARLTVVPGAGHAVHLEKSEIFRQLVLEFLKR